MHICPAAKGEKMEFSHTSVLLNETIEALQIRPDGTYVDCTAGGGGHSAAILEKLETGRLFCLDQDPDAIETLREADKEIQSRFLPLTASSPISA